MTAPTPSRLFVQTNGPEQNEILVYNSSNAGTLLPGGRVRTNGFGTGLDIGLSDAAVNSQGALAASADGKYLFAVNAGSNSISSFAVIGRGVRLVGTVSAGGAQPVSIAVHGQLVYVATAFGAGGISGFTLEADGQLTPLSGSRRGLSGPGAGPAQLSFTPDGTHLLLTELYSNQIVTYSVGADGRASQPNSHPSVGKTPFGFAFDPEGRVIVSEAFENAPQASAVSSYRLSPAAEPTVISSSVLTHQTSACWTVITPDGEYAYVSNSLSGSITGYRIRPNGSLDLLDPTGLTASTGQGSFPTDMAISADGKYLYVVNGGTLAIGVFSIQLGGQLIARPGVGGIPKGSIGLVSL